MSTLWLLRHGQAANPAGLDDAQRPLTERGEQQARESGCALAGYAGELAVVLTSPRVRARDTARLACAAHGDLDEPVTIDELGGHYTPQELLALISPWTGRDGEPATDAHVVVVGHNPELSHLASVLTGQQVELQTGTLVAIELPARRLLRQLTPAS